jgi:hypothetical protein
MDPLPDERLAAVTPGPDVLLTHRASSEIKEWISGWTSSDRLQASGTFLAGTKASEVFKHMVRNLDGRSDP